MIRRTPLKRNSKPIGRTVPVRKRRSGAPRRGPAGIPADEWRNPEFLEFLRDEGRCVACVLQFKENHTVLTVDGVIAALHVTMVLRCEAMHGPPNGRSQKGPDAGAIPGCRLHHLEQTKIGWPAFEAKYGFSREREAAVWLAAFKIWKEAQS